MGNRHRQCLAAPAVKIRLSTNGDADGILACLKAAFEPYESSYTRAAYRDTVLTSKSLRARMKTMTIFVAVTKSEEVVGTIACAAVGLGEGHLRGMAVHPEWHGRHVAEQLLERAEAELRMANCQGITLDTTEYLKRAIRFYERNGYRASGKIKDFFGMSLHEYIKQVSSY